MIDDTTAQLHAEIASLNAKLEWHRAILASSVDFAIIATDRDGRIIEWNDGAETILGWSADEMTGEPAERFFTPEDRAVGRIEVEMQTSLAEGRSLDERWHLRADGGRFWASGLMMPLLNDAGIHLGFLKILRDRTGEHEAGQALHRLEASDLRYRAILDTLDVGFCIIEMIFDDKETATDYRFIDTNKAFERHTGIVDGIGKRMREIAPDHEQHWFDSYGEVARTRVAIRFENGAEQLGGRWYDVHAIPIDAPEKHRAALLFNDITHRRAIEEQLRLLNLTLEDQVEQRARAHAHTEEQLRQSQKIEAIGQLTGGVAHDFNNLLTVIRGSVDLLRRPDLSPERRTRYIDAIGETADRAAKLTSQLLAFARRQALKPELFDVGASIVEVANIVRTLVGSRVMLETRVPDEPLYGIADRSQFDTAIVNMTVNARDAMQGEGRLAIAVGPVSGLPALRTHTAVTGDFIAVSITDTGSGIAPDQIGRIFEPFYTTKAIGAGTGLGLSQVFGFAKQTGGDVHVDSTPGAGTTFTLYLPRAAAEEPEEKPGSEPAGADHGDGACILVVEDNPSVGEFAREALKELGYDTVWASDADQALIELRRDSSRFHVVFSDVVMPGMSGIEMAQLIRAEYPDVPVVLTSGYSHILAQNGTHGFELLHKPYSIEQLARVLQKSLKWQTRVRSEANASS